MKRLRTISNQWILVHDEESYTRSKLLLLTLLSSSQIWTLIHVRIVNVVIIEYIEI